jgi:thiol-disulfide isomerase/thioredoxin
MKGNWVELADFPDKVILVNFWTSWCPPCVLEMPSLQRLSHRLGNTKFTVLAVNMGENIQTITDFIQTKVTVDFPILRDEKGAALRSWQVYAFPTSFVIGKSGKIRYALFGSVDWDAPDIGAILDELIKE